MNTTNKLRAINYNSNELIIKFIDDKLTNISENNNSYITLDAIFDKKRVKRTIDSIKEKDITKILKQMKSISKIKEQKFYPEFKNEVKPKNKIKQDKLLLTIDPKKMTDKIIQLNKRLLKNKYVVAIESQLNNKKNNVTFNCKNFKYNINDINIDFQIDLALKNKTEFTYYTGLDFFKKKDINFNKIEKEILENIELNKDPIEFKGNINNYDIMFTPDALYSIVNAFIVNQATLDSMMKKDTYLNTNYFDKKINIIENPFVDYSPYSTNIDFDFVKTRKKYLIKNGKQKEYITNLNDAYKYNKEPSGNNISGLITNLIFEKGNTSKDKLIKLRKKVILINNLIGIHTTNSKEGSLNVSALGIEYNNGKRINALKDIKLNEKIQDLFKNVEISKETKWIANYNLPYLLCLRELNNRE